MPLKVMRPPKNAEAILRRGVAELVASNALDDALRNVEHLESPLRVFVLDASALKGRRPLDRAYQVAWRYTLLDGRGDKQQYEARLLRFPIAYLTTLWLAPTVVGEDGTLIPVAPAPDGIESNRNYVPAELLSHLRSAVEKQLYHKVSRNHA